MGRRDSFCSCFRWSLHVFIVLYCSWSWIPVSTSDTFPASAKYREVTSVVGSVGQITCPVTSFDDVVMILWFHGPSGAPIYSYDARNEEIEPRHMTLKDDWGLRLYFRVWPNNRRYPALMIQDLKSDDGGVYRCRVDYRNSPTTNSVTRLKIIEPPTRLEVRDTSPSRPISDQQMKMTGNKHSDPSLTYLGPYTEGQNVTLVCSAYGGNPLPEVRWYKNGNVVDTSFSLSGTEYAVNEMQINNLGRTHTYDQYSCQANNNNETQALTHKVQLEIYLGVTSVELEVPSPMTAGSEYNLVCKTLGAYPTVKVEFWKNLKRIASRSQMKSVADNMTITSILFNPEILDDDTMIICKAENPWVSKKPTTARRTMKIRYSPVAVLRLGRNRTTALSEGESVLMECHVKANPPAHTILWFHQGRQLNDNNNTAAGIRITGRTLFISYLSHHVGGDYNCEAVNDVGKGISNTLPIVLHLSPKCVTSEAVQVPLAVGETQWLTCNILAWPSDLNFYWTLNRSDSTSKGELLRSIRNLTEHRLPISSSMAQGVNNLTTNTTTTTPALTSKSTNSNFTFTVSEGKAGEKTAKKRRQSYQTQNGYPQLSSGSPSESLDYPEDQHMPRVSSTNATDVRRSTRKETRSTGENILFEGNYPAREKAISGNKKEKSMTHSSDVVFSTSTRDATSPDLYESRSSTTISKLTSSSPTSSPSEFMSSEETAAGNDDKKEEKKKEKKTKRHVYPSSTHFSMNGKSRESGLSGFQDRIRHTSLISYQVRSDEDYGTVACRASNSFGSQVFPCLYHIIKKEDTLTGKGNKADGKQKATTTTSTKNSKTSEHTLPDNEHGGATSGNLTASLKTEILPGHGPTDSGMDAQRGFSKLHKTLGIALLLILIFIAGLAGLAFSMLFVLAKRRTDIRRIVIAHGPGRPHRATTTTSTFSRRRSSNNTNKTGKGAVANKSADGSSGEVVEDGYKGTDIVLKLASSPSTGDVDVTSSMDPFLEIAMETNKGKPQLSYISTRSTTSQETNPRSANKDDTFANNIGGEEEEDSQSPGAFMYSPLPTSTTMDMSPQFQFADGDRELKREGFKGMTPRAAELFASSGSMPCADEQYGTRRDGDDHDSGYVVGNIGTTGEYHSHLDKDCLLPMSATSMQQ